MCISLFIGKRTLPKGNWSLPLDGSPFYIPFSRSELHTSSWSTPMRLQDGTNADRHSFPKYHNQIQSQSTAVVAAASRGGRYWSAAAQLQLFLAVAGLQAGDFSFLNLF
jgi:hypothetical protein